MSHLKILESPSFTSKLNFCFSSKLISVQSHLVLVFATNDPQVSHGFSLFTGTRFCPVSPAKNFFGGMFEELSASAKICQVATNHPHF